MSDLQRSEAFYVGLLGLPVVRRWNDDRGAPRSSWVQLEGERFLALERGSTERRPVDEEVGHHALALRIEAADRAAWARHLESAGVIIERRTAYSLFFRDPDGALLAVSHYPDPVEPADL